MVVSGSALMRQMLVLALLFIALTPVECGPKKKRQSVPEKPPDGPRPAGVTLNGWTGSYNPLHANVWNTQDPWPIDSPLQVGDLVWWYEGLASNPRDDTLTMALIVGVTDFGNGSHGYRVAFVDGERTVDQDGNMVAVGVQAKYLRRFTANDWNEYQTWRNRFNSNSTDQNNHIPSIEALVQRHGQSHAAQLPGHVLQAGAASGASSARVRGGRGSGRRGCRGGR